MDIVIDLESLRIPTKEVTELDKPKEVAEILIRELNKKRAVGSRSVGLAANQLGFPLSMLSMRYGNSIIVLVNPILTKQKGHQIGTEMCLSLPGIKLNVKRPKLVTVNSLNQYLKPVKYKLHNFEARIVCHEIDHLRGILIIDKGTSQIKER